MQRSLSALLTAILAVPVVGYLTHTQLWAESQLAADPKLQVMLQSPNVSDFERASRWNRDSGLQHLALTSEQWAQIQVLQDNARSDLATLTTQLTVEQGVLEHLIASDDTSTTDLRMQHQVLQELQQAISDNRFEALLAMREVLTPEQRTLLSIQTELPLEDGGQKRETKIRIN